MKVPQIQNLIDSPQAMRSELNLAQLESMIKEIFPAIPLEFKYEIRAGRNLGSAEGHFCISSNDITDYCGAFAQAMESVRLEEFGTHIRHSEEKGLEVWLQLNIRYRHFNGGSNSSDIAEFLFEDGAWTKRFFKGEKR